LIDFLPLIDCQPGLLTGFFFLRNKPFGLGLSIGSGGCFSLIMVKLTPEQFKSIDSLLPLERPGPLVSQHFINTDIGCAYADQWPDPRGLLVEVAGNYTLIGRAEVFSSLDLQSTIKGFLDAPPEFEPLIYQAFQQVVVWERIIYSLADPPSVEYPNGFRLRALTAPDWIEFQTLDPGLFWITKTWNGPAGLAQSGKAWGAFAGHNLVAVACSFFVGKEYEDIAVVTEPGYRNLGLSTACAGKLCRQILVNGKKVSWTTSVENSSSRRVAEKLGFKLDRLDRLFVIGIDIP
jgi:hypothetical protein